jgi:protocatechuate 3,4-dioxygenase beta subunit
MHPGDRRTGGRDKDFRFYGEARTDAAGGFRFRTVLPGPYSGRPRHIHAKITPPGAKTLTTQFYFKGDGELAGDGTARGLGKALELVTLSPVKGADGVETATVTVVVRR